MAKKKLSFEEALKDLEQIADKIERGEIGLEESISQYEKGMALVKQCRDILAKAEMKIETLHKDAGGEAETSEFEDDG